MVVRSHVETMTDLQMDPETRSYRYYRNAVERHWDPHDVDLDDDGAELAEFDREAFDAFRRTVARFGAGEESVTEDLAPLSVVLDDLEDEMFVTTQLYEEAKHTDFFDRYWREVVRPEEERRGLAPSSPADDRWFNDEYDELFERNAAAMTALLDDDAPERRATAYCHYHLTIEGVLAQTGYYGLTRAYDADTHPELPHLPGLVAGLTKVRGDEGRHVGFGMAKLRELVESGRVDAAHLHDTVGELLPLVRASIPERDAEGPGPSPDELVAYAGEKHAQRMEQITAADAEIPDVDALTSVE